MIQYLKFKQCSMLSKKLSGLESHKGKSKEEEEEGEGEKKTWTKLEKFSSFPEMKGGE